MANYVYPKSGEPKAVHFDVTGKHPKVEEVEHLTNVIFPKKPISQSESDNAIKGFFKCIGFSVFCVVFGWLILKLVGGNTTAGAGIVRLMGYGILFLGTPMCIIYALVFLSELFRSGRKKTARNSFLWVWGTSILGNDISNKRFGSLSYALDKLERAVPENIDRNGISEYITRLREDMATAMEKTTSIARSQKLGTEFNRYINTNIENFTELFPNVSEIGATITCFDILSGQNEKNEVQYFITAIIKLHIKQVFIKTGKYWYPYDLIPDFQQRDED